jgi:hypothetical protein
MSYAPTAIKREALLMIDRPLVAVDQPRRDVGDWLRVAGFVAMAAAVTMAPFLLL